MEFKFRRTKEFEVSYRNNRTCSVIDVWCRHCDRSADIHWVWRQFPCDSIKSGDRRPGGSAVGTMYSAYSLRMCQMSSPLWSSLTLFSAHSLRAESFASLLQAEGSAPFCEWWSPNTRLRSGVSPVFWCQRWKGCQAARHWCNSPQLSTSPHHKSSASATRSHSGHFAEKITAAG